MENFILMENKNMAIQCTRRQIRELSDGTLEVKIQIQPTDKANFLLLFPDIDLPAIIVRLTPDAAKQSAQAETINQFGDINKMVDDKPKGGALAKLAGIWCSEPNFLEWLNQCGVGLSISNENDAKLAIYEICGVMSRIELDSHESAGQRFHENIREPYAAYLRTL